MISSLSATELCRFHCQYTGNSVRHYHQLCIHTIYSNFHSLVHYFLDLIIEVSMTWTHGRGTRTHDQNAIHPVSLQVIAEEWILKAESWEGAKGLTEIWVAKTRLVSRLYPDDLQMMSHLHEAVMFVERKTCFLIQCVMADAKDFKLFLGNCTTQSLKTYNHRNWEDISVHPIWIDV